MFYKYASVRKKYVTLSSIYKKTSTKASPDPIGSGIIGLHLIR